MGASVTAEGGCTNNKMAADGAPSAPSPSPLISVLPGGAPRRQPGPRTKGLFCERRETRAYLVNSFRMSGRLKYWPGRAVLQSQPPPLFSRPRSSSLPLFLTVPLEILRISRLLKITNIQLAKIFGTTTCFTSGTYKIPYRPRHVKFSSSSLNDLR